MKDKTLKTLEYDKILSMLAAGASSAAAKEKLLGLSPMTDQISVMEALGETTDCLLYTSISCGSRGRADKLQRILLWRKDHIALSKRRSH